MNTIKILLLLKLFCVLFILYFLFESCIKTPQYFYQKGVFYDVKKDYIRANKSYTKAITKKNDYLEAYFKRAESNLRNDSVIPAINDYTKIIEIYYSSNAGYQKLSEIYYMRANAYYSIVKDSMACRDWKKACDLTHNKSCDMIRKKCK